MDQLPYPPPFQDLTTLAKHICASESTIENWVKMGIFPKPKLQGGKRMWKWKDVERHFDGDSLNDHNEPVDLVARIKNGTRKALEGA
jgi:hypothetical protein